MLKSILTALLMIPISSAGFAWETIEDWLDPIGGHRYTAATTTNEDGFSLFIFRELDGKVRAVYSLPANTFDRMPYEGRVLAIRPDDFSASVLDASIVDSGVVEKARSNGQSVKDVLWHGEEPSPTRGTLRNILDSKVLFARFYTDMGSPLDTSWSLEGGPEAISRAANFEINADPDAVSWSNTQAELLIAATQRCGSNGECLKKTAACMQHITKNRDVEHYNSCLEEVEN